MASVNFIVVQMLHGTNGGKWAINGNDKKLNKSTTHAFHKPMRERLGEEWHIENAPVLSESSAIVAHNSYRDFGTQEALL